MSVVAFVSFKNSPGLTTAITGIGATWPSDQSVLVVEADPAGGDIGPRFGFNPESGIASLAAAARRNADVDIYEHTHSLPGGLTCLFAPVSPDHAKAAISLLATNFGRVFATVDDTILVDCGRLDSSSAALGLLDAADQIVVGVRPELASLSHAIAGMSLLRSKRGDIGTLIIGSGPYKVDEISEAFDAPVLGCLPFDRTGAGYLSGAPTSDRALGRTPLVRECRAIGAELVASLSEATIEASAS